MTPQLSVEAETLLRALAVGKPVRTDLRVPTFVYELILLGLVWRCGFSSEYAVFAITTDGFSFAARIDVEQQS